MTNMQIKQIVGLIITKALPTLIGPAQLEITNWHDQKRTGVLAFGFGGQPRMIATLPAARESLATGGPGERWSDAAELGRRRGYGDAYAADAEREFAPSADRGDFASF